MKNPKVLIVGQPFNSETGGGITLSNLFKGWSKESLAVVSSSFLINENTDISICDKYYQLGSIEHKWMFPFNLLKAKHYSGQVEIKKLDSSTSEQFSSPSSFRVNLIMNYFYPLLEFIGIYHAVSYPILSEQLINWIKDFNPDIIYVQATSRNGIILCKKLQDKFKEIPFVFHMMDDWPSKVLKEGVLGKYWHKKIQTEFREIIHGSKVCLGISDYMGEVYEKKYGKKFIPFHNPIDIEFWKKSERKDYSLGKEMVLLYAGRIGIGIDSSLKKIAEAVELVNKEHGHKLYFVIQSAAKPKWIGNYKSIKHNSFVEYENLPKVFSKSDFLILPYDFQSKSQAFIKFSMPTKAPEYFASGSPVIIFSPEDTALVKYAEKHYCAKIVTKDDKKELAKALKDLIVNEEERRDITNKAKEVVEKYHNATIVRNKFKSILESTI
ncbi:glycosyltransferase family protein [Pleomorphovibrio marinus]|uniref:glycosyltransferase family protein n=1 Tax=Pleomorphovibrio marinus TaxID=2164132 RepID=UPI000E0C720F|nr:glycosyltransferase [Pleomorphovibrio marinus]